MDELLARIRVALRRRPDAGERPATLETPDFPARFRHPGWPPVGARRSSLTPTEWALMDLLHQHADRMVPNAQLLREVWGPTYEKQTHYLRVYVAQLRRKLEPDPAKPRYLLTVPATGDRLDTRDLR